MPYTNSSRQTVFSNIPIANNLLFNTSATGFATGSGYLNVVNQNVYKTVHLDLLVQGTYSATFIVDDGNISLSGAQVTFNNQTLSTDAYGKAIFSNIISANDLPYSVNATGFETTQGTLNVGSQNVSQTIHLLEIPQSYFVTFNVDDGTSPVIGAQVTFNSQTLLTNGLGQVVFPNVISDNNIDFYIIASGFVDNNGLITVSNKNIIETVHLAKLISGTYIVTFTVQEEDSPLANVYVTFNSEIKKTGSDGKVKFYNVYSAYNQVYSAEFSGYKISTGSLDLNGSDLNSIILMWPNAIKQSELSNIEIYPNPVQNILSVSNILNVNNISRGQ